MLKQVHGYMIQQGIGRCVLPVDAYILRVYMFGRLLLEVAIYVNEQKNVTATYSLRDSICAE